MTSINNSCGICCEDFNKSSRAKVDCPQCEYPVCRGCTRTYLLGSNDEAHCLNCKNRWELDTVTNATLKSFINKEYKEHRKSMLFEREQSRLPDTMGAVENYKKVESMVCEHLQLRDKITEMRDAYNELKTKDAQLQSDIRRYRSGEVKDKKKFTKGCPKEDCRGFLSTQWKCGLCKTNVCSKCLIIKELDGAGKIIEHECCQDDVKSAELIKKETRSCPSCATSIYKIEGCDQMWCTQCHTAFSWKSGLKVNGVVHNPHFYQWQNAGANAAPVNVPGAVMCGGLPHWYNFKRDMASLLKIAVGCHARDYQGGATYLNITGCFRASQHFTNWELDRVRRVCNTTTDNTELRIQYIVNLMTEDEFKAQIMKRDKKLAKNTALLQIYELVNTVFIETIRDVYESLTILKKLPLGEIINAIDEKMQRLNQLRSYANNELAKISVLYSQSVSIIKKDYYTETCKFSKNNIEKILNNYN